VGHVDENNKQMSEPTGMVMVRVMVMVMGMVMEDKKLLACLLA